MHTIATNVSWCRLRITPEISRLLERLRELRRTSPPAMADDAARFLASKGVGASENLAADPSISDEELAARCYALRGVPWSEAKARRDMRERMRIWRYLEEGCARVPSSIEDMFALWNEATRGEVAIYRESETAQLRRGIPFAYEQIPFEYAAPAPGKQTVAPNEVEHETRNLIEFIQSDGIEPELHAAASLFALYYIHPFRDGNGRLGRLLTCAMLADHYSASTLLALVENMQAERARVSSTINDIVHTQGDIGPFVTLILELIVQAIEE